MLLGGSLQFRSNYLFINSNIVHIKLDTGLFWVGLGGKNGCNEVERGKNIAYALFLNEIAARFDFSKAEGFIDGESCSAIFASNFCLKLSKY